MNLIKDFESLSACPKCKTKLIAKESAFECTDCKANYPIIQDIPRFVSSEGYSESFGFQWNKHSKTQLDRVNGTHISRDRLYRQSNWTPQELANKTILECGSGAGRFTQILCESQAKVFSIDYSTAVLANKDNNSSHKNLFLAQASIYELPFQENSFDFLMCLGVIQHTPNVELTLKTMLKYLKPGGRFSIDAYAAPLSYLHPRVFLRPFTSKMEKVKLYKLVEKVVPKLLPLSTAFHKIPVIGQLLARLVPVANWRANIKLPHESMYLEWAILDTYDWLSPAHEYPQTRARLQKWLQESGVGQFEILRERGLYIIRGQK